MTAAAENRCAKCARVCPKRRAYCSRCYKQNPGLEEEEREARRRALAEKGPSREEAQEACGSAWKEAVRHLRERQDDAKDLAVQVECIEEDVAEAREVLRGFAASGTPLVDVREQDDYDTWRVAGLPVINLPWRDFRTRAFEFPPRDVPFAVLTYDFPGLPERHLACLRSVHTERNQWEREPWQVLAVLRASPALRAAAEAEGMLATGHQPTSLQPFLWKPCTLVERLVPVVLSRLGGVGAWSAVDLGCGPGRDCVFLAKKLVEAGLARGSADAAGGDAGEGRGVVVHGIDSHPGSGVRLEALAARAGVAGAISWHGGDLKGPPDAVLDFLRGIQPQPIMLALGVRFNHRPLFGVLREAVAPGGIVAWAQFQREEGKAWTWEHPSRPDDILEPGELAAVFHDWEILTDETEHLHDGRPLQHFVAIKPR